MSFDINHKPEDIGRQLQNTFKQMNTFKCSNNGASLNPNMLGGFSAQAKMALENGFRS